MKLDKLKFAQLVSWISHNTGSVLANDEIVDLDNLIDVDVPDVPEVQTNYPAAADINTLIALMYQGMQKLEAIKLHRKLTGYGLKESKDEVEKYWVAKPLGTEPKSEATLGDILKKATER